MPYVFYDEVPDGMEAADAYSPDDYNALMMERDTAIGRADALTRELQDMTGERDSLMGQLDDAKRKFADSFLSSPARAKARQAEEMRGEERPSTFESLFRGRNRENAN